MKFFVRSVEVEIIKMKHTFLFPLHVILPIIGSGLFLPYYQLSSWDELGQISGYMEVIGIALPFAVSIVCAENIRLEEQNHFQILLGSYAGKWSGLAVKCLVLTGMGALAIFGAVFFFASGYHFLLGKSGVSVRDYMDLAMALVLGSIPLYLEHLFLNLTFSRSVSQCVGVAQFLLAALFLTGLGDGRWQFFPSAWSARGVMLVLGGVCQGKKGIAYWQEWKASFFFCLLLLLLICGIIGTWFHYYEGRQCHD